MNRKMLKKKIRYAIKMNPGFKLILFIYDP